MADLIFDDSSFRRGMNEFQRRVERQKIKALGDIADELLRLSQLEVPFDVGTLQGTGDSSPNGDEYIVSYNTPYAARLHEHPEYNFQNNRKGKYLEDPMKMNLSVFRRFFDQKMGEVFR